MNFPCESLAPLASCVHDGRMTTPDLIGTAEAARILGKSHRTIHRLVKDRKLVPAFTAPGGQSGVFLFVRHDVEALAEVAA